MFCPWCYSTNVGWPGSLRASTPTQRLNVQERRLPFAERWPLQFQGQVIESSNQTLQPLQGLKACLLNVIASWGFFFLSLKYIDPCLHSYSSRDYNSRDSRDYAPPPRDYSYREYSSSSNRDDYGSISRGYKYVQITPPLCCSLVLRHHNSSVLRKHLKRLRVFSDCS